MTRQKSAPIPTQLPAAPTVPIELQELSITDTKNRYSLVNLVPPDVAALIQKIPARYFALREDEFIEKFKPHDLDFRLKLKFWDEWQLALMSAGSTVRLQAVYYGVCTREYFYDRILKDPAKLAFMITPPTDYEMALREMLYQGLARVREILRLPFVSEEPCMYKGTVILDPTTNKPLMKKKVDKGLVTEVRQVVALLADRVHGAIVNRMQVDNRSVSVGITATIPSGDPLPTVSTDHLKAIDDQLSSIRAQLQPVDELQSAADAQLHKQLRAAGLNPEDVINDHSQAPTVDAEFVP